MLGYLFIDAICQLAEERPELAKQGALRVHIVA